METLIVIALIILTCSVAHSENWITFYEIDGDYAVAPGWHKVYFDSDSVEIQNGRITFVSVNIKSVEFAYDRRFTVRDPTMSRWFEYYSTRQITLWYPSMKYSEPGFRAPGFLTRDSRGYQGPIRRGDVLEG